MRALAPLLALSLASCAFGVEQYRERPPAVDLAIRLVDDDAEEALPRWDGSETLHLAGGAIVRAEHIENVRLLESAAGEQVIVLLLRDPGRDRLREVSAQHVGDRLAIVAAGRVVAAPVIRAELTESEAYVQVPAEQRDDVFRAMCAAAAP